MCDLEFISIFSKTNEKFGDIMAIPTMTWRTIFVGSYSFLLHCPSVQNNKEFMNYSFLMNELHNFLKIL